METTTHNHGGGGGDAGDGCEMAGMMMYFHTGHCETVLFESWRISSEGQLIGSVFGIMFLAALYEGLKSLREYLFKRKYNKDVEKDKTNASTSNRHFIHHLLSPSHALQTILHAMQILLSYFLMLIFMTYNVWLCLAVVVGATIGYFLVGWSKSQLFDDTEHCH